MQTPTLTRETWAAAIREAGLTLEYLAVVTGKSYSTVYRYSNGSRRPSDEWLAQVAAIVATRRVA